MPNGTHIPPDKCGELRRRFKSGETQESIADDVGCSVVALRDHLHGRCIHNRFVDEEPTEPDESKDAYTHK